MHPKPLHKIVDEYKQRESDNSSFGTYRKGNEDKEKQETYTKSIIKKMHQNKREDLERQYEKLAPSNITSTDKDIHRSPTHHTRERAFSKRNIKQKW